MVMRIIRLSAEEVARRERVQDKPTIANPLAELQDRAAQVARETIDAARLAGGIVISATVGEVTHRKDSGWLRANIDSNGFTGISGTPYNCIKLEKGMKIEATGIVDTWRDRKQLSFSPSGLLIVERSYCEDPFMRAVQRACKSFTQTRLQTLETVLGKEWVKLILNDPWIDGRNEAERILIKEHGSKWRQRATAKS
jgi:hypothetical protein